jgi:hypothetical protein
VLVPDVVLVQVDVVLAVEPELVVVNVVAPQVVLVAVAVDQVVEEDNSSLKQLKNGIPIASTQGYK